MTGPARASPPQAVRRAKAALAMNAALLPLVAARFRLVVDLSARATGSPAVARFGPPRDPNLLEMNADAELGRREMRGPRMPG